VVRWRKPKFAAGGVKKFNPGKYQRRKNESLTASIQMGLFRVGQITHLEWNKLVCFGPKIAAVCFFGMVYYVHLSLKVLISSDI